MPNNAFQRAKIQYQRDTGKLFQSAILGGYDKAGNPIIDEPLLPGHCYCRFPQSDGTLSASTILPFESTMKKDFGAPIRLGYNRYNQLVIIGADTLQQGAQGTNTLGNNANDPNVSYYIVQQRITTANSHPVSSSVASMLVTIQNWLWIENREVNYFLGGSDGSDPIDLEPYIPTNLNEQCLACLFVAADNTLEINVSTPIDIAVDLDITDIQECVTASTTGSKPVWAWRLYNGQTTITSGNVNAGGDDFMDLRQFINVNDSGGGSSSLAVTDGTTTVTDVTDITFNGADFVVTDLTGGAVQVDLITPSAQVFPQRFSVLFDEVLSYNVSDTPLALTMPIDTLQILNYYCYQTTPNDGDYFTCSFVLKAGTYTCYAIGVTANNRGKIDWSLDGASQTTGQDWYNLTPQNNITKSFSLTVLTDGYHVLKGVMNGKNASATNYYWALSKIWCVPASD